MNIDQEDLEWLSGYIEAEGYIGHYDIRREYAAIVSVDTSDYDCIEKIIKLTNSKNKAIDKEVYEAHHKRQWRWQISGIHAISMMQQMYPYLSERRRAQADKAIDKWQSKYQIKIHMPTEKAEKTHRWLAGLIEGDGTIFVDNRGYPILTVALIDEDTTIACHELTGYGRLRSHTPQNPKHNQMYYWTVNRKRHLQDILTKIEPHMCTRRREQIEKTLPYAETKYKEYIL